MDDLDALLADLETTTSHIAKRPVLLSDPLLGPQAVSSDTGLGQVYSNGTENDVRPPPPAYTPQQTVSTAMKSGPLPQVKDAERLYSTVCKPKSPKTKEQMGLSSSSVLGGGLNELDHLLQELNATQFNITDEILAQFPSSKTDEAEKLKQFQASVINSPKSKDETAAASTGSGSGQSLKPSATAATLELDKLMASLSDFKVQTNPPDPALQPTSTAIYLHPLNSGVPTDLQDSPSPNSSAPAVTPPRPTAPPPPQSSGSLDSMLGLLQSDLTRQGIPTTAKGTCAACQKPIVSQVVTALGQTWHPEHFVCTHCQKEIGASNFFEKDGLPYCEEDYFMLFSPRCGLCNQPILDKMVTALDKNWHPEHFCCVKCGRPFGEEGFHERDGKQYCQKDFFAMFATRCQGCSQPILENYISALNVLWHPECFVCRECYTPFINGSFFEHEGQPLCETHYHRSRGSLCSACEKPITGRCITAMGAKFHPEHFVCAFCLKQLNKGTFKEQGDKPYCHPCFFKLFG